MGRAVDAHDAQSLHPKEDAFGHSMSPWCCLFIMSMEQIGTVQHWIYIQWIIEAMEWGNFSKDLQLCKMSCFEHRRQDFDFRRGLGQWGRHPAGTICASVRKFQSFQSPLVVQSHTLFGFQLQCEVNKKMPIHILVAKFYPKYLCRVLIVVNIHR